MHENSTPNSHRSRSSRHRHEHGSSGADPRSPFVFDVRLLGRQPGSMREHRRSLPAPTALGNDFIGVPDGAPLVLDARLQSVTEGVLVTGTVTTQLDGECARCLDPITEELSVDIVELFAYPDSATDETTGEDEVHRVEGDYLDVEPVVRDTVVLALPWTPLCAPDCAGLCPECGHRLDDLPDGHVHETIDPRWAALAQMSTEPQMSAETSTEPQVSTETSTEAQVSTGTSTEAQVSSETAAPAAVGRRQGRPNNSTEPDS